MENRRSPSLFSTPVLSPGIARAAVWVGLGAVARSLENRRSPSLFATPVLSPGIARAAVWVGLGAVARSRGIGWRPGAAGFEEHTLPQ